MDISFNSYGDNILIRWIPDTCYCILIVESDFSALVSIEQKCNLHNDLAEIDHLSTVHKFNQGFDERLGPDPTREEVIANQKVKDEMKKTTKIIDVCENKKLESKKKNSKKSKK